uniref:Uncharacterized protein n=1 Tax=Cucumis melo TaxID=3656 RepID=A0A9I9EMX3_CUCME
MILTLIFAFNLRVACQSLGSLRNGDSVLGIDMKMIVGALNKQRSSQVRNSEILMRDALHCSATNLALSGAMLNELIVDFSSLNLRPEPRSNRPKAICKFFRLSSSSLTKLRISLANSRWWLKLQFSLNTTQGYVSVVDIFIYDALDVKVFKDIHNVFFDQKPIVLVKRDCETIRTRCFPTAKKIYNPFNLCLIERGTQIMVVLLINLVPIYIGNPHKGNSLKFVESLEMRNEVMLRQCAEVEKLASALRTMF